MQYSLNIVLPWTSAAKRRLRNRCDRNLNKRANTGAAAHRPSVAVFKKIRSSRYQMFFEIGVLKSFVIFRGNHLPWSLFLTKLQGCLERSCEYCKIFKNNFFKKHFRCLLLKNSKISQENISGGVVIDLCFE